jgi:hypothetical protein
VCFALLGVIFCLDFNPFLFFPSFIYFLIGQICLHVLATSYEQIMSKYDKLRIFSFKFNGIC